MPERPGSDNAKRWIGVLLQRYASCEGVDT